MPFMMSLNPAVFVNSKFSKIKVLDRRLLLIVNEDLCLRAKFHNKIIIRQLFRIARVNKRFYKHITGLPLWQNFMSSIKLEYDQSNASAKIIVTATICF